MSRCAPLFWLVTVLAIPPLAAQELAEIELRFNPADGAVRPAESVTVQVLAYGYSGQGDQRQRVRLRRDGATLRIVNDGMGWLSQPFRYPNDDAGAFASSTIEAPRWPGAAVRPARSDFQDAVLFTAGERPGDAWIEATLDGHRANKRIDLATSAPQRTAPESFHFGESPRRQDAYRALAETYAPVVAQQTWFEPKADYLARVDFDGDWAAANNWANTQSGSSQAYVYYAAMETRTHWFLVYSFFHPRSYGDDCEAGGCHENGNTGLVLTIRKDGSRFGQLQAMQTLAYGNVHSYRAEASLRSGLLNLEGDVEFSDATHPVVFVEAGGHGVYASSARQSGYSLRGGAFSAGTGVTYTYRGRAERPTNPNARDVGYELLPAYDHLWLRATRQASGGATFGAYFAYQPTGNRPRPPANRIAGAFLGQQDGRGQAQPFWAWSDARMQAQRVIATGQWALDPAYSVAQTLSFPNPVSPDYTYNPYLGVGQPSRLVEPAAPEPISTPPAEIEAPDFIQAPDYNPSARGAAPPAAPTMPPLEGLLTFAPSKSGYQPPDENEGFFDLRFFLDGEAAFYVRGEQVFAQVLSGGEPVDAGSSFTAGIPASAYQEFTAEKRDGRGEIQLLEAPNATNGYTATVRMSDPPEGDGRYHARLHWITSAEPEAPAIAPELPQKPDRRVRTITPRIAGEELPESANVSENYDAGSGGEFTFRGTIDGRAVFRLRGGRAFVESTNGRPVETESYSFSQPLPAARLRSLTVERHDGRGSAEVTVIPLPANEYTATIEVDDPQGGSDVYHFTVRWQQ